MIHRFAKSSPPIDPPRSRESSPKVNTSGPFILLQDPSAHFRSLQHASPFGSLQPHSGPFSPVLVPSPTFSPPRPLCRIFSGGFGVPGTPIRRAIAGSAPRDTEHNKAEPKCTSRAHRDYLGPLREPNFFLGGFSDPFKNISRPFTCTLRAPSRSSGVPASSCARNARSAVFVMIGGFFFVFFCCSRHAADENYARGTAKDEQKRGQRLSYVYIIKVRGFINPFRHATY